MKEILYDWGGANVWLFHVINDIRYGWLDYVMLLGTGLGDHELFPLYLGLVALFAIFALNIPAVQDHTQHRLKGNQWMAAIAVFSLAYLGDSLLLGVLKPYFDFPRPPLVLPSETVRIIGLPEFHHSLPSGHASFAMLFVASLWPVLSPRLRVVGVFFVLWVGISRISLGAHFPADVLAGFLFSLVVVLLVSAAISGLMRQFIASRNLG